jgi:hypothetical protein
MSDEQFEAIFQPYKNTILAAAEKQCKTGDETVLSLVQDLIAEGLPVWKLQTCLVNATSARCHPLIKSLLALGVPLILAAKVCD